MNSVTVVEEADGENQRPAQIDDGIHAEIKGGGQWKSKPVQ